MILDFIITKEYEGVRLDVILPELMEGVSRNYVQKLFAKEKIKINGEINTLKKYSAHEGDKIEIDIEEESNTPPMGEDIPLDILFEDDGYIVLNKPKGLVVHPGAGNESGTLVNGLIHYLGEGFRDRFSGICDDDRPGIVHRIDKDTTGLLVVAKQEETYKDLSVQFREHTITRKYIALTYNNFKEDEGRIDIPIGRDPKNRLRRAANGLEPRNAITNYRVLERMGNYTLIEARLETGRTHQIRVHMAHIGHPVVGDPTYGPRRDLLGAGGQMLHAGTLGFNHIRDGYIEFKVDPPEAFLAILEKARR